MSDANWYDPSNWTSGDLANILGGAASIYTIADGLTGDDGKASKYASTAAGLSGDMSALAAKQAQLAQEQWDYYKDIYQPLEEARAQEELYNIELNRPLNAALVDQSLYNISAYRPVEEEFVSQSLAGLDPATFAQQAGADVASAFDQQNEISLRNAKRSGSYNPNSGSYQKLQQTGDLSRALASAGAQTQARRDAKSYNLGLLGNALNVRSSLPSQTSTTAGTGSNLLSSATSGLSSATSSLANAASNANTAATVASNAAASKADTIGSGIGMGLGVLNNYSNQQYQNSLLKGLGITS